MNYTIEEVTTLIGAHRYGTAEASIGFLLTDSRSLCFAEETLFFALTTSRNDGHRYIADLHRRGVRNFVVQHLPADYATTYADSNFLKVTGVLQALQRLAERHRDDYSIPVVGITGSNGKTIVKEWLYQLLSTPSSAAADTTAYANTGKDAEGTAVADYRRRAITRSPRSYNSQIGVPLSVWLLGEHSRIGIFEAGISQPGEMAALRAIIQPTIGVLTNIGQAHQENFPSLEAKCKEKLRLFHDTEAVVYPMDDELVVRCMSQYAYKGQQVEWSLRNPKAALYVSSTDTVSLERNGKQQAATCVNYVWNPNHSAAPKLQGSYTIPFIDEASVENSITAAATLLHLGLDAGVLAERMSRLEPVAMRLEVKQGQRGCTLINDSYNSDINSLDIALDFICRRPDSSGNHRTLILSDIEQSGESDEQLYRRVAELIEQRGVERFVAVGPRIMAQRQAFDGFAKGGSAADGDATRNVSFYATTEELVESGLLDTINHEVVLIKGARQFGFDRITELMTQKVHETTLEVNLSALVANLNYYRQQMRPDTKLVCMIKADGYGAGAVEIAKTLQDNRVDYLAVAVADEGVTLRNAGITSNIMVMNPEMTAFKTMFDYDLEPEVYSFRLLSALVKAARKEGITNYPVHIKLDTGMCRLGFNPTEDIDELIHRLKSQNAVIPRSVFSHFVGSDSDDFDEFSARQFALFDAASRRLQEAFPHTILRHIDNSAGIEHFPERQLDMCRLGIGLYGINPRNNKTINTVSTLRTTILQLRRVKAGESVGYSRRTVLERDSIIAAIPIGYADGLNRHLGNRKGYCLVDGQRADYVGNICMDVAMVDVTDIPCSEGDSVEIFGNGLPVTVLSDLLDTIPYEVLTGVSNRVKRVYYKE
ncbi:MAG: bifunctional UDP-N-acetylmuramoyl-tripeptide:D-alanyl-D-alanine ligase/alanine racemase [Prevotella sp.]|nr:bifunctional UDP-N-acetylmuramoyl-tripeptide:D-alanyl-D-alanine ligase/alanine racemase [Prevotella sp.]